MNGEQGAERPIGMMDSGVGGVSVLAEAARLLPAEDFLYYGDTRNAPYGTRPLEDIRRLAMDAADMLVARNVKALVVACNTATSAAIVQLRERLSIPVIGMEPALKPAAQLRHGGTVLVLATPATLSLPKFHRLMHDYGEQALPVPAAGLMEWVERGVLDGPELLAFLRALLAPYQNMQVDAVVLGCTHYVFLRGVIERFFPEAAVVDGNAGTAAQLRRLLETRGWLKAEGAGRVAFLSSGGEASAAQMKCLYEHVRGC